MFAVALRRKHVAVWAALRVLSSLFVQEGSEVAAGEAGERDTATKLKAGGFCRSLRQQRTFEE